ncbi:MAG: hypothetical protein JO001_29490 [Alphaproteobacteria bacterium]|nr:hypothetical protein [Alphaproteobacteria bacterium]
MEQIKALIDAGFEKHLATVHEEISDIRAEMATADDVAAIRADMTDGLSKVDDRLLGIDNRLGGIDRRLDDEALRRNDFEERVRSVVPNLPPRQPNL